MSNECDRVPVASWLETIYGREMEQPQDSLDLSLVDMDLATESIHGSTGSMGSCESYGSFASFGSRQGTPHHKSLPRGPAGEGMHPFHLPLLPQSIQIEVRIDAARILRS